MLVSCVNILTCKVWSPIGAAGRLVEVQEMVMSDEGTFRSPGAVQLVDRPMGRNTIGVVAWLLLLRTPECPDGRQVISLVHGSWLLA